MSTSLLQLVHLLIYVVPWGVSESPFPLNADILYGCSLKARLLHAVGNPVGGGTVWLVEEPLE